MQSKNKQHKNYYQSKRNINKTAVAKTLTLKNKREINYIIKDIPKKSRSVKLNRDKKFYFKLTEAKPEGQ